MTRKQRRATFIAVSLGILALAVGLVLYAMRDSIVYFYSPSDVVERGAEPGQRIRLVIMRAKAILIYRLR